MATLSLHLLGPLQATLDGEPISRLTSPKLRSLLVYLAAEAERSHRRERLAALLWPDHPDAGALIRLRFALSDLRCAIGDHNAATPFLLISRETIRLNPDATCWVDAAAFLELLAGEASLDRLQLAVDLYKGSFLDDLHSDSPVFEEWMLLKREQFSAQAIAALHQLAAAHEQRGSYLEAEHYARRQLALDPSREEAHRQVMRLLALRNERSAALAQYESCRRVLKEELGVAPGRKTVALYESIRDETLARESVTVSAPCPHPLPAVASDGRGHAGQIASVFVARERELAQLGAHLTAMLARAGRAVFISGDAGSGKTALLTEFTRRAEERELDLVVVGGSCNVHTGVGDPYLPFREILEMLGGDIEAKRISGNLSPEQAARLWTLLPDTVAALVEHGPGLIDLLVPGEALAMRAQAFSSASGIIPSWLDGLEKLRKRKAAESSLAGVRQVDLFEQVTRVLRALSQRHPLILVLDDLQWADSGSISLLFHLGRRLAGSRILVLAAYRPDGLTMGDDDRHPLETVVHELQREFGNAQVDLEEAAGQRFVDALMDAEPNQMGGNFREKLFRHTGGHALFTVELLRGLQERGDLIHDEQSCWIEGASLDWEQLPPRVEAVIAERLARLPAILDRTLAVASVEGAEFTAEVVARASMTEEREICRQLSGPLGKEHRLVVAKSMIRCGGQRLSRYRFRHFLLQQYLYGRFDPVELAQWHETVGEALEALWGDRADEIAVQLARHFELAGMAAKAVEYLLRAGNRAEELLAHQEAVQHFRQGFALLASLPASPQRERQEVALRLALGSAHPATEGVRSEADPRRALGSATN